MDPGPDDGPRSALVEWSTIAEALTDALAANPEAVAGVVRHIEAQGLRPALEAITGPLPEPGRRVAAWHSREAHTDWGGLLLLLHLVEEGEDLHALGTALLHPLTDRDDEPLDPADPALLAFAGLGPDDDPPPPPAEPPTTDHIRQRLDTLGLGVEQVCRKPAVIVADPGWIEARFSLDDVDVDIRRAGLDLDPGWLPWLGVVVRFRYV